MAQRPIVRSDSSPPPRARGDRAPNADDNRLAPDPLTLLLPALAALGSIASIAAVHWAGRESTPGRPRGRRKAASALRDLEANCLGLQHIFRRMLAVCGEAGKDAHSLPLKLGVHGRSIPQTEFASYQQLANDIASGLVLASQNSFDVVAAVEDGEIEAPERVFFEFGEQQERLNQLLIQRPGLRQSIDTCHDVAVALTGLVGELKKHRREPM